MRRYAFDVETDGLGEPGRPPREILAGYLTDGRVEQEWGEGCVVRAVERIVSECAGDGRRAEVWAHFGGGFDFRFVMDWLRTQKVECDLLAVGSLVLRVKGAHQGTRFELLDSIRLLPAGLDKVGAALGLEKGTVRYEHDSRACAGRVADRCVACLARTPAGRKHLVEYWRRDLEILWAGIHGAERMLAGAGVDRMRITLASNAAAAMRARAGAPSTPCGERGEPDVDGETEEAYFGGRVEVYRPHAGAGDRYDVNSSYPAAMAAAPLPWSYRGESVRWQPFAGRLGVVSARVTVPADCAFPVLPYRAPDGRVFFPTGSWDGSWTEEELRYAVEVGAARIDRVRRYRYWGVTTALQDFAREGYAERQRCTGFEKFFWKIFLNSAYGKLIEGREKERITLNPRSVLGLVPFADGSAAYKRPVWYQPAIRCAAAGAYITARGRVLVHRYAAPVFERLCYTDTDSLDVEGGEPLPTSDALGGLKREASFDEGRWYAAKMYALRDAGGWRVKAKGLPGINMSGLERMMLGGTWTYDRTTGAREMLRGSTLGYDRRRVSKRHRFGRPKRAPSGSATRPWTVAELAERWDGGRQLSLF